MNQSSTPRRDGRRGTVTVGASALFAVLVAAGCGGSNDSVPLAAPAMACDDGLKTAFKPDAGTQVLLVKAFKAGDSVALSGTPASPPPPVAPTDLCLVKLLVGPGNPGPVGAPSTSPGIGIEVWLPTATHWNERIRAFGSGGWAGSAEADVTSVGGGADGLDLRLAAAGKGFVVATSNHGFTSTAPIIEASFAMNPDGTINTTLWKDFAERSLHEMAVKSKALAKLYYGKAQKFAYWDGYSTGGRQGMKLAQVYPDDFDGILAGAPAINWTRFITSELYPQVVMKQDLGGTLPTEKLNAATSSAVAACGGAALGYLIDPYACHYDPTKDAAALCSGVANGSVVGNNASLSSCLSLAEATAINKIWYGQTADGSVPDPVSANAPGPYLNGSGQLWFGLTRGTDLGALAGSYAFPIAADQVALEMQDPSLSSFFFKNATKVVGDGWANMTYSALVTAAYQGLALQPSFSNINTDNPDLSAFSARNGKLLLYHGLADNLIAPQGSDNYYNRVVATMGPQATVQSFFRYYHVPGLAHSGRLPGPATMPLPQTALGRDDLFQALQKWTEEGQAPDRIDVSSADGTRSLPLCVYPKKITWNNTGSQTTAASYTCQ